MTAHLPDDPAYAFCPVSASDGEPPQIRIVVEDLAFGIPTALVPLSTANGLAVRDTTLGRNSRLRDLRPVRKPPAMHMFMLDLPE